MQVESFFLIAVIILSVVIHEVSHGYAANFLGDPTARLAGRLTLNPLKHLDLLGSVIIPGLLIMFGGFIFGWAKPVPYNPYNLRAGRSGPAIVAAAGPAANLFLALLFALMLRFAVPAGLLSPITAGVFGSIAIVNIMLAVFNLLPVPPLDGSKILFAVLPWRLRFIEDWFQKYQFVFFFFLLFILLNSNFLMRLTYFLFRLFSGVES